MKRIFLFVLAICFLFNITAFSETVLVNPEIADMSGSLKILELYDEELPEPDLSRFNPISFFGNYSNEDFVLNNFYFYLHPSALSADSIVTTSSGLNIVYIPLPIYPSNISNGYVTSEYTDTLESLYNRFVVENPKLFYLVTQTINEIEVVTLAGNYYAVFPAIICSKFPEFDASDEAIADIYAKYDELCEEISRVAAEISFEGMTDLDKLLLAHDYITDSGVYYTDFSGEHGDGYSFNAYGTLINKKSVCQGYSLAYGALLQELGFASDDICYVMSTDLKHIWNIIKLDGRWYHVDVTHDDPTIKSSTLGVYDMTDITEQRTRHNYFLTSTAKNKELRNKSYEYDMEVYGSEKNAVELAVYDTYESGYIFNTTLPGANYIFGCFSYENGKYILKTDTRLYSNTSGTLKMIFDSITANDYVLTQPFVMTSSNGTYYYKQKNKISDVEDLIYLLLFNGNKDVTLNEEKDFFFCFYGEDGRLLNVSLSTTDKAGITFQSDVPDGAKAFKILCSDDLKPLSNTVIIEE